MAERLTADKALELLIKDVIKEREDLEKPENRWVKHCIYVAIAAGRIAEKLGLDADYAIALGYTHDIGRKLSHPNHTIVGYEYMIEAGFEEEARICLTHSFIDNDINNSAGGVPRGTYNGQKRYDYMNNYLVRTPVNAYDNIVQMCDLFCLETGFTTVEHRMLDITRRKGVYDNSLAHLNKTMELKGRLEQAMGCSLYDLFPEIDKDILEQAGEEHKEWLEMVSGDNKKLNKK